MEESIKYLKEQFGLADVDIKTYSPQVLAYIGDGIYELIVRTILVGKGNCHTDDLHRKASRYVRASAQAAMILALRDDLTEEEHHAYKRGRNAKAYSMAKHATMSEYRHATGFEALMGYLYLTGRMSRMTDLIRMGMERTGGLP